MSKIQKTSIIIFSLILIFISSFTVSATSSEYIFNIPCAQPQVSDKMVFVEVLHRYNGKLRAEVIVANMIVNDTTVSDEDLSVVVTVTAKGVVFTPSMSFAPYSPVISICSIRDTGAIVFKNSDSYSGEVGIGFEEVVGIHCYGDFKMITSLSLTGDFIFNYASNALAYNQLNSIISILSQQNNSDITQSIEQNTDEIKDNQDQNTQEIIDNQNQIVENEKNETNNSGNSASESVGSAIPDKSEGFITALNKFVNAMKTTDTNCLLTFPSIKIPSIEGLFPETVLSSEYDVNFNQVVNLIPSTIMTLIQSVTTVALIVFCFKEVYDTISEALTRRKSDE